MHRKAIQMGAALAVLGAMMPVTKPAIVPQDQSQQEQVISNKKGKGKGKFGNGNRRRLYGKKYTGADLRKIRKQKGVGRPPEKANFRVSLQMNEMHLKWLIAYKKRMALEEII